MDRQKFGKKEVMITETHFLVYSRRILNNPSHEKNGHEIRHVYTIFFVGMFTIFPIFMSKEEN